VDGLCQRWSKFPSEVLAEPVETIMPMMAIIGEGTQEVDG